ncbi:MAG: diguanylate cyclase [Gammaproteobacteria bacterium]|nr:diguanylate cyclase [Gammaproteobacteria bacterium]
MNREPLFILLLSNNHANAMRIGQALGNAGDGAWRLEHLTSLAAGIARARQGGLAAVLLDLFLPDCQGVRTFDEFITAAPLLPVVVIVDRVNEVAGWQATRRGAQDHLLEDHLDAYWLPRLLRSAIEQHAAARSARVETERAQITLNSIGDAVLCTDRAGAVTYLNRSAEHLTGWSCEEAMGRPVAEVFPIVDADTREASASTAALAIATNETVRLPANSVLLRRDGSLRAIEDSSAPIRGRDGRVSGAVLVFRDVTAARAIARETRHLALHDGLTDLPNRLLLDDRLAKAIALARRHRVKSAVLFIDLDNFKAINESLGHATADQVLRSVAQRLVGSVRDSDTVSRLGGDEFVVLLSQIEHFEHAALRAEKILTALAQPHTLPGTTLCVSASIGIGIYPDDGQDAQTLLKCADAAMYYAKDFGRNTFRFYTETVNSAAAERRVRTLPLRPDLSDHAFAAAG